MSDWQQSFGTVQVAEVPELSRCAVCLAYPVYPVRLKCGHLFCYMCIKGALLRSRHCPLCRAFTDLTEIQTPVLVSTVGSSRDPADGEYLNRRRWYYEGQGGWWQYEDRTAAEIEDAYRKGCTSTDVSILGKTYEINLQDMVQFQKNSVGRRRRIKWESSSDDSMTVKGITGIPLPQDMVDRVEQTFGMPGKSVDSLPDPLDDIKKSMHDPGS